MKPLLTMIYKSAPYLAVCLSMFSLNLSANALSGYCMQRDSDDHQWVKVDEWNFMTCDQKNTEEDQDDIFDETGLIYWNSTTLY